MDEYLILSLFDQRQKLSMLKKSLAEQLFNTENSTPLESKLKETAGLISLLELESLQKKLDDYYNTIYNV